MGTNVTGDLAVIGVMYKYGEENPLLEKIWPTESAGFPFRSRGMEGETPDYMHEKGAKADLGVPIDVMSEILPEDHTYYAYRGSLTTPPCSDGVGRSGDQLPERARGDLRGHPHQQPLPAADQRQGGRHGRGEVRERERGRSAHMRTHTHQRDCACE